MVLNFGRRIIPWRVFKWAQPIYHWGLSMFGAVAYGFPSRSMKVIAVTGTKGKSTTVYMISKIFEEQGLAMAIVGSLGFKIKDHEWPNTLKMTLPGRTKLQKFLWRAKRAGCQCVVLEATSEGIAQNRLAGVNIDCAVFTNLHREHLESHGSFENYVVAKQKLFLKIKNIHILNIEDSYYEKFANFPAKQKVTYGKEWGIVGESRIKNQGSRIELKLLGDFNLYNALAALAVAHAYGLDMDKAVATLNSIESIPGRMEVVRASAGFSVVIDYAHTPDSLRLVYQTLKNSLTANKLASLQANKLICVLGAAGGGRDKWKRPEFGRIAAEYCDEIILTNEDPYDENPEEIIEQIASGFSKFQEEVQPQKSKAVEPQRASKLQKILDRKQAIQTALTSARAGDIVVITGKGSETSMAIAGGRKIPWSDKGIVQDLLK